MAKQAYLSKEMEPKRIKEIDDAASELSAVRIERIALNKKEDESQASLVSVMEKHKLKVYKFGKWIVTVEPGKTKAKVKEAEAPEKEEDNE